MTRKFKHKKTGKVVYQTANGNHYVENDDNYILKWVVENSPESWLEITEPEVPEYMKCESVNYCSILGFEKFTKQKVYKVKSHTVKEIVGTIETNLLYLIVENDNGLGCSFSPEQCSLRDTYKPSLNETWFVPSTLAEYESQQRHPIFRTEDGVDVFEGDKYWWVCPDFSTGVSEATKYTVLSYNKKFSTEVRAKEWILYHKRLFSLDDFGKYNITQLEQVAKERTA
jgi:hypothetical protein